MFKVPFIPYSSSTESTSLYYLNIGVSGGADVLLLTVILQVPDCPPAVSHQDLLLPKFYYLSSPVMSSNLPSPVCTVRHFTSFMLICHITQICVNAVGQTLVSIPNINISCSNLRFKLAENYENHSWVNF